MAKEKKKFKDTKVGKFITEKFPNIAEKVGDALPDKGVLGIVKNLVKSEPNVSEETRLEALKMLNEYESIETQEITKRWQSDMTSDSKMSKAVRPLTLMFLTLFICTVAVIDSTNLDFGISDSYITLFKDLLLLVYFAYFGGRTAEKWKKISK